MVGNIRGWADGNRAANYEEDTTSHMWRVNFMAFLAGSPNAPELTLSWFHIERNNSRRYISNESVGLSSPTERIFFHSTVLHRAAGEFDPMLQPTLKSLQKSGNSLGESKRTFTRAVL